MNNQTKILIVDDEDINLDIFDVMFSKLGFTVEKAKDGIEGLEKVRRFLPDIVLLDNIMPRMSGWELTKILKNDAKYKDIIIVMFSDLNDVKNKVAGFELGVDDYITKPFNFSEVLARIRALLRTREPYAQIAARESRLSLAEELSAGLKQDLLEFAKTIDELEAVIATVSSQSQAKAGGKDTEKILHMVADKSQKIKKCITELEAKIEKTSVELEQLKKDESGLALSQAKMQENPVQE
ncbi:MAG: response regulator [Treponema sp.]|nr:response regulator [Treponema sp.]